jgi:hypothetical protein
VLLNNISLTLGIVPRSVPNLSAFINGFGCLPTGPQRAPIFYLFEIMCSGAVCLDRDLERHTKVHARYPLHDAQHVITTEGWGQLVIA